MYTRSWVCHPWDFLVEYQSPDVMFEAGSIWYDKHRIVTGCLLSVEYLSPVCNLTSFSVSFTSYERHVLKFPSHFLGLASWLLL